MITARSVTLAELARESGGLIQTGPFGSQLHASDYVDEGVPVIMPKNIGDGRVVPDEIARVPEEDAVRLARHRVQAGDIVYSRRGDVERHALIRDHESGWLCGTGCLLVRIPEGTVIPRFLSSFLRTEAARSWIVAHAIGATMANLNTKILGELSIRLPPLPEQRAIAEVLGALDDKIELNERMNATLDEMARALFKSWFVDFDPVRAKAEGSQPSHMDAATATLFPASFEESALGPIPAGWRVSTVDDVIDVNPRRSLRKGDIAPYVDMAALPTAGLSVSNVRPREFTSGSRFMQHDTLLARITPCLENGKTAFVDFLAGDEVGWGSTEFIVLRPRSPLTPELAYLLAREEGFRDHAIQSMTGSSGRQRVPADAVARYPIAVPGADIADAFGEVVGPWFALIKANAQESRTLAELRDVLLPRLISGKIRVGEAAPAVEVTV